MTTSTSVERRRLFARRALLSLSTILCSGLSAPVLAQLVAPAPVRQSIDANGVDLFAGTMNADAPGVSMGQGAPQGLSYHLVNRGNGWTDNLTATLQQSGSTMIVSIGGAADSFSISGTTYTASQGNGATLTLSGTTYTYTARDGTVVHFSKNMSSDAPFYASAGRATDRTSPDGSKLVYNYDSRRLYWCSQRSANGQVCTRHSYAYRAASVVNSYGYEVNFTYGSLGDGYTYPDDGPPPSFADFTTFSTPTGSSLTNAENSSSSSLSYTTSTSGSTLTVSGTGHTVSYRMSGAQIAGITRAGSDHENVTVGYGNGRVSSVALVGGTWSYSAPSDQGNTRTVTVTDPLGRATVYTFDIPTQVMTSMTDALGNTTSWTPDASGRITLATAPEGNSAAYTYDDRGNVTQAVFHAKPSVGGADITTSAVYPSDADCAANAVTCNEPTSTTDARGNTTSYSYDPTHGGVLTATGTAPTSGGPQPQVRTSYSTYTDYFGGTLYKPNSVTTCRTRSTCTDTTAWDAVVASTDYGSLSANNLLPVSMSKGAGDNSVIATTTMTYDGDGNVASIDGPLPGSADTTTIQYGTDRQPTLIVSPDPGHDGLKRRAVRTSYNGSGQAVTVEVGTVDANGGEFDTLQEAVTTYDGDGRKTQDAFTAGGTVYQVAQYSYDALNRVTCSAQRMNPASWTSQSDACTATTVGADGPDRIGYTHYDEVGRPDAMTSAYGTSAAATERMSYTLNGKTASVTDANGNVTSYGYDGFDRALRTCYQTTGACTASAPDREEVTYDGGGAGIGTVTSRRLRDGQVLSYDYDILGRRTYDHNPKTNVAEVDVSYSYDLLGQMLTASDGNGWSNSITYDALGRGVTQASNISSTGLQYDPAGRLVRQTWADGFYVTYDYDTLGQMTAIHENGGFTLASFTYDDLGRRTSLTRGNGVVTNYNYDGAGRLQTLSSGGNTPNSYGFGYNVAGQITSRSSGNDAYAWTGAKNATSSYAVNGLNQYTNVGGTGLGYDGRGNLTTTGSDTYQYNSRNQLFMNAAGQLIYRGPSGLLGQTPGTNFNWVNGQLAQESSDHVLRRYVYGPSTDEPLVWYEGSGTSDKRYLVADERGSIVGVTDANGNQIATNTYDEHGVPGANNQGRFGYTGQIWIPELKMWDYKARMYSPSLGRFMQTDPIGYGDGLNWYGYAHGDAVNGTDSSGLTQNGDVVVNGPSPGSGSLGGATAGLGLVSGLTLSGSSGPRDTSEPDTADDIIVTAKKSPKPAVAAVPLPLAPSDCTVCNATVSWDGPGSDIVITANPWLIANEANRANIRSLTVFGASVASGFVLEEALGYLAGRLALARYACFAAGTLVQTNHGLRPIETIKAGDMVLSRDEKTGQTTFQRVTAVKTPTTDDVYAVELDVPAGRTMQHHASFRATATHPWRTADGRWVSTADLRAGMKLIRANGAPATVISEHDTHQVALTYNLTIQGYHTYFVGKDRVWVHNACLTDIGRGLTKKFGRPGSAFPRVNGNPDEINQAAQEVYDNIMANGQTASRYHARFGDVTETRLAGVGGVRFDASGNFMGFLEP